MGQTPPEPYLQAVKENLNLTPFVTVKRYLYVLEYMSDPWLRQQATINLLGNVGLFLPLGFCVPSVFPKFRRLWKVGLLCLGLLVCVETLQLFTLLGSGDVDDLILNMTGVILGFGLWKLAVCFFRSPRQ